MTRWSTGAASLLVTIGLGAGMLLGTGTAQASDASVRGAIEGAAKELKESPKLEKEIAALKNPSKADLQKVVKAVGTLQTDLQKVASKVSAQTASTTAGKEGEEDWLEGIKNVANGFGDFKTGLLDLEKKSVSTGKTEVKKGAKLIKQGSAEVKKGDALLKVKTS
jgi:hypothetical protein